MEIFLKIIVTVSDLFALIKSTNVTHLPIVKIFMQFFLQYYKALL